MKATFHAVERSCAGFTPHAAARRLGALAALWLGIAAGPVGADTHGTFANPVLRGAYPDPSLCEAEGTFYLVNSTFEYFPGLPIHRSRDLVNWELIGYGLHRDAQVTGAVNLVDVQSDGGIHAPTIRCHEGRFYLITTNVYLPPGDGAETEFVNFVLTADDPAGPWSEPHVIDGAPGIDPDLFFDDDGRAWYLGTHSPENPSFPGEGEIWLQELDTERWALKGERHLLWRGACGGVWAEGPHLYKRDGRYYLLVAEGGTSFNHAVVVASSREITGPYESNPRNPILTSRHLSYDHWVNSTGHGDLFELPDGRWYMVLLGIRGDLQRRSNMGRETHLVPVTWEREPFEWKEEKILWPVVSPESGRVQRRFPLPYPGSPQRERTGYTDEFDAPALNLAWNFRRVPRPGTWSLTERPGFLRLHARPQIIAERARASLLGLRQTETAFTYQTTMDFTPAADGSEAGMALFQKDDNYLAFTVRRVGEEVALALRLAQPGAGIRELHRQPFDGDGQPVTLRVSADREAYRFEISRDGGTTFDTVAESAPDALLSRGYTGAYLGLYATTNGRGHRDHADFDRVRYAAEAPSERRP